jgi:serine protease Do
VRRITISVLTVACLFTVGFSAEESRAQSGPDLLQRLSTAMADLAAEVKPGVVAVKTETVVEGGARGGMSPFGPLFRMPQEESEPQLRPGLGSGVIVSKDGYILTNNHVIVDNSRRKNQKVADRITVELVDHRSFEAKVVGRDPLTDLAVLKIDADDLPVVDLGDSDRLRVGEWVLAVGNPRGQLHSVTRGIVSALGRSDVRLTRYEDFIQTDASINPGNSGGALINMKGELVGINTAIASNSGGAEGIGFAIPVNMARDVMQKLIADGEVRRGYLGISPQDITAVIAETFGVEANAGVLVAEVLRRTAADDAGIKRGDIIIEIEGQAMDSAEELRSRIGSYGPGDKIKLKILRQGDTKNINVVLGDLKDLTGSPGKERPPAEEQRLGLKVETLTGEMADGTRYEGEEGVVVTAVKGGSPADRAGLKRGDLIIEIDRQTVKDSGDFYDIITEAEAGESVLILFNRNGNTRFVALRVPK